MTAPSVEQTHAPAASPLRPANRSGLPRTENDGFGPIRRSLVLIQQKQDRILAMLEAMQPPGAVAPASSHGPYTDVPDELVDE